MDDERDIMTAMFKGDIKPEQREYIKVEIGDGKGIGNRFGTYQQYARLSKESPIAKIGKNVIENSDGSLAIVNETTSFNEGETPVVLVEYRNLLHSVMIKLTWRGSDMESMSAYEIPAPLASKYRWWDLYYVFFYAPEGLRSGEYMVGIESTELARETRTRYLEDKYFEIY